MIKVAGSQLGRQILVEEDVVPNIRNLFDDKEVQIRANAYKAMISLCEFTYGIDQVI
jgi:hypothetical protein